MTERIDLLECQWFVRRQDLPADIAGDLLDALRTSMPMAEPLRFGSSEPLRHTVADAGDDGFREAWQTATPMLFWKATPPCHGGYAIGLGDPPASRRTAVRHPVGSIKLMFDLTASAEAEWRASAIDLFGQLIGTVRAFYAHVHVTRGWGYTGRSLWSDAETRTRPQPVHRDRWRGLPPFPLWLVWCGPPYASLIKAHSVPGFRPKLGGVLRQSGDHPTDAAPPAWPKGLAMQQTAADQQRIEPATLIPRGL